MKAPHVVVMGVAGCGKSAVGRELAHALVVPLIEGDDFHPAANVEKMRRGIPLDDADRAGWLQRLAAELGKHPSGAVLTCSALKRSYRDILRTGVERLLFVHLALSEQQALARVSARPGHFYPPQLVPSQFAALEPPGGEAGVITVDAAQPLQRVVEDALQGLRAFNNP